MFDSLCHTHSLWEHLFRRGDTLSLIFEDNVLFTSASLDRLCAALARLRGGFEYLNAAALRPKGTPIGDLGLIAVYKGVVGEPMPNILMSLLWRRPKAPRDAHV